MASMIDVRDLQPGVVQQAQDDHRVPVTNHGVDLLAPGLEGQKQLVIPGARSVHDLDPHLRSITANLLDPLRQPIQEQRHLAVPQLPIGASSNTRYS